MAAPDAQELPGLVSNMRYQADFAFSSTGGNRVGQYVVDEVNISISTSTHGMVSVWACGRGGAQMSAITSTPNPRAHSSTAQLLTPCVVPGVSVWRVRCLARASSCGQTCQTSSRTFSGRSLRTSSGGEVTGLWDDPECPHKGPTGLLWPPGQGRRGRLTECPGVVGMGASRAWPERG